MKQTDTLDMSAKQAASKRRHLVAGALGITYQTLAGRLHVIHGVTEGHWKGPRGQFRKGEAVACAAQHQLRGLPPGDRKLVLDRILGADGWITEPIELAPAKDGLMNRYLGGAMPPEVRSALDAWYSVTEEGAA